MLQTNVNLYKYTPDEMSKEEFLSRFVIRTKVFKNIFNDIKNADFDINQQHHIIVGQRGQGKTSLLRRLKIQVEDDKYLSSFLFPIKFAEEQYRIRNLTSLWEEVADYLQSFYEDSFDGVLDEMEKYFDDEDYELKCFSILEKAIKEKKKKLLLLIDNIDELFSKLKLKEQRQLREILLNSSSFVIVGASTKIFEQHYDYGKPFYEFFKIIQLKALSFEECKKLLLSIGNSEQKKKIENLIKTDSKRIEVLRQLTGGIPRTMVMLFDIFTDEKGNAFDDLLKILDEVTPLYKHRMDDLPTTLQEIVHTLAMNWDGMFTKEIAKKMKLQSKEVSAQLKQLEKNQLVIAEYVGKNKIYKIQERFFNIWYLMRYGRKKDRQRVEWLVKFLISWYSKDELEKKAENLIFLIGKEDDISEKYIYNMCEALSYSGKLNIALDDYLKKESKKFLDKKGSDLSKEMTKSDRELILESLDLTNMESIKLLENSKKNSEYILSHLLWLYYIEGIKLEKALFLARKLYENNLDDFNTFVYSLILLWKENFSESYKKLFESFSNKDKYQIFFMDKYLLLAISKGQYYKAKEIFELEKYNLKEVYKPIWYALMTLMKDEFPNEIKKMGSELEQTVKEILSKIADWKEKYKV